MAKKTSLKDIAQTVGVSTALVSYVLNNKKEDRINKEVAKQIRKVAQELNYQPNQIAKSLKTNKTYTLGLVVADIANQFSSSLARSIEEEADKRSYTVIYGSSGENSEKCRKLITTLLNRQVDGLLICAPEGIENQLVDLQQQSIPFVLIDRYFPTLKTNYVALDNYQSVRQAVQHLIDSGYRRIGLITFKTALFHINERTRGYRTALAENNIPFKKSWFKEVNRDTLQPEVSKAIQGFVTGKDPVDAVVFISNDLSINGLKVIKALQVQVPKQIAVVSFDETEAYDLFYAPPTYLKQPIEEMGRLATTILLEAISLNNRITQVNLDATLVVQASTQPVPAPATNGL